ncbi:MAG: aldose epimerase [Prevotella sp.]|nr:aldose epimerase [Prevotella sp.]
MKHLHAIVTAALLGIAISSSAQEPRNFHLTNGNGMEAVISNYGARLVSLTAHNWNGRLEPVVKGYDKAEDYQHDTALGATLIRFGMDNEETLSGKVWEVVSSDNQSVSLRYMTSTGENGHEGKLNATVTYTLSDQNALDIDYRISTTAPTSLEVTNGIKFNISGDMHRSILKQHLWIDAYQTNTCSKQMTLTGTLQRVRNTAMNFTKPREIGERINETANGYSHAFQLRHPDNMQKPAAILFDAQSGRAMTVYSSEPSLLVNTYGKKSCAISLQPLHSGYNSGLERVDTMLIPGQVFHGATVFFFTTDPPLIMRAK